MQRHNQKQLMNAVGERLLVNAVDECWLVNPVDEDLLHNNVQSHLCLAQLVAVAFCGIHKEVHEGPPLPAPQVKHLHMGLEVGLDGLSHAVASRPDAV